MPYATVADLQDRLGEARLVQLTDLQSPPLGLVDLAVAQKALDDADAEIDGYLVGRYALPLATVPAVLRVHAITLASNKLLGERASEIDRDELKATREFLDRVAQGKFSILAPAAVPPVQGAGNVIFSPGSKVMGREV